MLIQSFEPGSLRRLQALTGARLVQLIDCHGQPGGLASIRQYAWGVGVCKDVLIPRDRDDRLGAPSPLIGHAHALGLVVHGWTFRRENRFLPFEFRRGSDPNTPGDLVGEIRAFQAAGMDGYFTDNPDIGVGAR